MTVVVVATVVPKPEGRAKVLAAFERAIDRVHSEDAGCELYALNVADDQLVMIEKWRSADDLAAHARGDAVAELERTVEAWLARPTEVRTYEPHPAGLSERGAL